MKRANGAFFSLISLFGLQQSLYAETPSQVIHVSLSRLETTRHAQLKTLGSFDVLGVNYQNYTADIKATGLEIETLMDWGFAVSFAEDKTDGSVSKADVDPYLDPDKLESNLQALEAKFPDLIRVFSIGESREGRKIWGAEVTAPGDAAQKATRPSALFNSMHHARELMTTEVAFDILQTLTEEFDTNAEIADLLQKTRVVVVPQVNPDGNAKVHKGEKLWRKNTWAEGSRVWGVDLNRNYPTLWNACNGSSGQKSSDSYRGPSPASEPETNGMMKLVSELKPVVNISYHAYSELVIFPFGCAKEKNPSRKVFESLGNEIRAAVIDDNGKKNTYKVGPAPEVIYEADGTDIDWQWQVHNVVSFAMEVNSSSQGFQPKYAQWRDITVERQRGGWLAALKATANGTKLVSPELRGANISAQVFTATKATSSNNAKPQYVPFDADTPNRRWSAFTQSAQGKPVFAFYLGSGSHRVVFSNEFGEQWVKDL